MNNQKKDKQSSESQPATTQSPFSSPKTDSVKKMVAWAGPLPPPQAIQKYEEIIPGAANRILEMTEKQQAHRFDMERKVIAGDSTRSLLGMIFGFITFRDGYFGWFLPYNKRLCLGWFSYDKTRSCRTGWYLCLWFLFSPCRTKTKIPECKN